ncbi:MAG: ABC transporter permease subunit [Acidobacteria bacterium]|nr:ABC transporter permease subunit [Acidobacteriota bacterium]
MTAPSPAALSFRHAAVRVFDLSLGEMLWSRRTVFMAVVAGGPMVIAVALRLAATSAAGRLTGSPGPSFALGGPDIFGLMIWAFYLRFTVPVLGVFYGTSLIADEVEDRTLTYLFTRPIPRGAVLVGKYLAYLVCTSVVVLPSVVVVYFSVVPLFGGSIGAGFPSLVVDLGLIGVGLAVYGAAFAFVGARLERPLLSGLLFIFGWEPVVVLVPGYMKNLSIAYYLQGLVPHAAPQDEPMTLLRSALQTFDPAPAAWVCLLALAVIWAVALGAAVRTVERREYVLER